MNSQTADTRPVKLQMVKLACLYLGLLLIGCKSNPRATETSSITSEGLQISNNGVKIDYRSYGQGDYTLLFVHGWCINQNYWSEQVRAFSSDYRVVTIDLPGFGQSGKNKHDWSMESYGADVRAVIDELALKNVILIGHSMGGDVILEAALQSEKVLALIGADTFKDVGAELDEAVKAEIDDFMNMLKSSFAEVVSSYAAGALFHTSTDSVVRERVIHDFKQSDSVAAIASLEALFDYSSLEFGRLSRLNRPLYLINSSATPTDLAGLEATGINFEVLDVGETGHYPMIENPERFNQLLQETILKVSQLVSR